MKKFLLAFLFLLSVSSYSQEVYKLDNGSIKIEGDKITFYNNEKTIVYNVESNEQMDGYEIFNCGDVTFKVMDDKSVCCYKKVLRLKNAQ